MTPGTFSPHEDEFGASSTKSNPRSCIQQDPRDICYDLVRLANVMVSKGSQLELEITSAAFEGKSVARVEGLVVFVPYGVPGDRVRATVTRKRRKYIEASIDEVITPSPDRIEPRCRCISGEG